MSRAEMFEGGSRRGSSGFREWRRMMGEVGEHWSHVGSVKAIDADRVLVITPTSFRFRASGLGLDDQPFACLVTVRAGKIVRTEVHGSEEEAREAG